MPSDSQHDDNVSHRTDVQRDIGYILAKIEDLSNFVKSHMEAEEKKYDQIDSHIDRLSKGFLVLLILIILDASGVPLGTIISALASVL